MFSIDFFIFQASILYTEEVNMLYKKYSDSLAMPLIQDDTQQFMPTPLFAQQANALVPVWGYQQQHMQAQQFPVAAQMQAQPQPVVAAPMPSLNDQQHVEL